MFDDVLLFGKTAHIELYIVEATSLYPKVGVSFSLDALSFCFSILVVTVGFCTNIYALNYFKYEANEDSFLLLVN